MFLIPSHFRGVLSSPPCDCQQYSQTAKKIPRPVATTVRNDGRRFVSRTNVGENATRPRKSLLFGPGTCRASAPRALDSARSIILEITAGGSGGRARALVYKRGDASGESMVPNFVDTAAVCTSLHRAHVVYLCDNVYLCA